MAHKPRAITFGAAFVAFNIRAGLPKAETEAMAEQWMTLFDLLEQVNTNLKAVGQAGALGVINGLETSL